MTTESARRTASPRPRDGRHARGERTRQALIDATLALFRESDSSPTAERITMRAGVSQRVLFNHFDDRTALFETALLQQHELSRNHEGGSPVELELEQRIDWFAERRADLLERMTPVVRGGTLGDSAARASDRVQTIHDAMAREVERLFAQELAAVTRGSHEAEMRPTTRSNSVQLPYRLSDTKVFAVGTQADTLQAC